MKICLKNAKFVKKGIIFVKIMKNVVKMA